MPDERTEKSVSDYYNYPVVEHAGKIGAGLIWFMTRDHLSPPVITTAEQLANPEEWVYATRERVLKLGADLGIKPKDRVLDMGTGIGGPGRDITNVFGCSVIGVNIADKQLASLLDLSREVGSTYNRVVGGDMQRLPFANDSFDSIFTINALYHAPNYQEVLTEAYRTLKPGAKFGIDDWFLNNSPTDVQAKLRYNWKSPEGFHDITELTRYGRNLGFSITSIKDFTVDLGMFLAENQFGIVYDEKIAPKLRAAFIELYPDSYKENPAYADQAVSDLRTDVMYMGELYRTNQAVYQQIILQKAD